MRTVLIALAAALALTGCDTSNGRSLLSTGVLPAKDLVGIHTFFPSKRHGFNSVFDVTYFPQKVTQPEIEARVARICAANRDLGADGSVYVLRPPVAKRVWMAYEIRQTLIATQLSCFPN